MPKSPRNISARRSSRRTPTDWTWDDWAATALYFTKAVNPDSPVRYGTVLQMKNLLFNMMVFQSLPRAYGADWMDESGKVTVNCDAYRTGARALQDTLRCRRNAEGFARATNTPRPMRPSAPARSPRRCSGTPPLAN